jgi:hydrogenase expression/formation protein HypC
MCLAVPARIIQLKENHLATAEYGGNRLTIEMGLVDAAPGDYVLVHAGCAVERIDETMAADLFALLAELQA